MVILSQTLLPARSLESTNLAVDRENRIEYNKTKLNTAE